MNPKRVITKEAVAVQLKSSTKDEVISELIDLLVTSGRITDKAAATRSVMERERKMSTGLQNGIAIPHGKTDTVDTLVAAVGIKKEGIPFDSLDGSPAQVLLLTLSPATRTGPHIQFLAEISRKLHDTETRQKVINATTPEEIMDLICSEAAPAAKPAPQI